MYRHFLLMLLAVICPSYTYASGVPALLAVFILLWLFLPWLVLLLAIAFNLVGHKKLTPTQAVFGSVIGAIILSIAANQYSAVIFSTDAELVKYEWWLVGFVSFLCILFFPKSSILKIDLIDSSKNRKLRYWSATFFAVMLIIAAKLAFGIQRLLGVSNLLDPPDLFSIAGFLTMGSGAVFGYFLGHKSIQFSSTAHKTHLLKGLWHILVIYLAYYTSFILFYLSPSALPFSDKINYLFMGILAQAVVPSFTVLALLGAFSAMLFDRLIVQFKVLP